MLLFFSASAQKDFKKEGDAYYSALQFNRAIDAYKKAKNSNKKKMLPLKAHCQFMIGECYAKLMDDAKAQEAYETALKMKYQEEHPEIYFKLAQVLKSQGKYEKAKANFKKYYDKTGDALGKQGMEDCESAIDIKHMKTRYKVQNEVKLNKDGYDMSACWGDKKFNSVYYTSDRTGSTGDGTSAIGTQNKDVWHATRSKQGDWQEPVLVSKEINSEHDEGAAVTDARGTTIYFTRCEKDPKERKSLGCNIWWSKKKGKDWGEAELVEIKPEGADSIAVGHPALTPDGKVLIFASNMPGGQGGIDLWYTTYNKREKKWDAPINLGPTINTKGDDMFPHVRTNGDLYFASNGHPGLGGLDIFKAVISGDKAWGKPENMGRPINSNADDFAIIFEGNEERGLFTTNRVTKKKDEIYNFNLPPKIFTLACYVINEKTKDPIQDVEVTITSEEGTYTLKTDENGAVKFDKLGEDKRYINDNVNYNITVFKKGEVLKYSDAITTIGSTGSKDFIKEFLVKPVEKIIRLPEIRYDFARWELQVNDSVNSKDSLNFVYNLMTENPGIVMKLRSHTDCRGGDKANELLAKKRAQSCIDYLVNEKGIAKERLIPVGMGEYEPIPGLECKEIDKLPTKPEREAAHQRNRRTDCQIISWDFVPDAAPTNP